MESLAVARPGTPQSPFGALIARDVIVVEGPEAGSYLQSQLSQDLGQVEVGGSCWSLLLHPTGKAVAWLRVARIGEESWELDLDAGAGEAAVARLERFKLRTKATLSQTTATFLAVRGLEPAGDLVGVRPVVWPGTVGYDQVQPDPPSLPAELVEATVEEYELARIASGVPRSGAELTDDTIPAEAGAWLIEASVSFTKGCYPGQELVARVDSRGSNVPRPVRIVSIAGEGESVAPAVGDEVVAADGTVSGTLTSVAADPTTGGWLALAPLRRAVGVGESVTVAGRAGRVEETPAR